MSIITLNVFVTILNTCYSFNVNVLTMANTLVLCRAKHTYVHLTRVDPAKHTVLVIHLTQGVLSTTQHYNTCAML